MAQGLNISKRFFSKFFPDKSVDSNKLADQSIHIGNFDALLQSNNQQVVGYEYDLGTFSTSGTININFNSGVNQRVSINTTSALTFNFSNPINARVYLIKIIHSLAGTKSVTWPGSVKWQYEITPILSTTLNSVDLVSFYYDGTYYYGSSSLGY